MNKQFEILSHTADFRLKVFGTTKEEIFKNALLGMAYVLKNRKQQVESRKKIKTNISIKSPDINSLLVDFLSEVLYQSEVNHVVYCDARFKEFSDISLRVEISGITVEEFDRNIKAVTYHELDIKKNQDGLFETTIIFDI